MNSPILMLPALLIAIATAPTTWATEREINDPVKKKGNTYLTWVDVLPAILQQMISRWLADCPWRPPLGSSTRPI